MTKATYTELSHDDLEQISGGRMTPTVSARGDRPDGDIQLNDNGAGDTFGAPDALVG